MAAIVLHRASCARSSTTDWRRTRSPPLQRRVRGAAPSAQVARVSITTRAAACCSATTSSHASSRGLTHGCEFPAIARTRARPASRATRRGNRTTSRSPRRTRSLRETSTAVTLCRSPLERRESPAMRRRLRHLRAIGAHSPAQHRAALQRCTHPPAPPAAKSFEHLARLRRRHLHRRRRARAKRRREDQQAACIKFPLHRGKLCAGSGRGTVQSAGLIRR